MSKEILQMISELKKSTLGSYIKKAINKLTKEDLDEMSQEEFDSLVENFEQLDELSKTTLRSYIKAATKDKAKQEKTSSKKDDEQNRLYDRAALAQEKRRAKGQKGVQSDAEVKLRGKASKAYSEKLIADIKAKKRMSGVFKAASRLATNSKVTKEEVERIEELSKKTLGSYYNKASVDSADHSRKALDAFSDGDKEKDNYHFKKMNKREIGKMKAVQKGKLSTNEDINEACKVGDAVIVRTAQGDKEGKVNDITNTHIGIKHPNVKGIIHYHPEYVKKNVKEAVDETLIEGVSWERCERSHAGSKEVKKSNRGQWMISKHKDGYRYGHKEGEDHITVNGTGKEAAQKGAEWTKEKGHHTAYVLESFLAEEKKPNFTLSSIANSALTTNRVVS